MLLGLSSLLLVTLGSYLALSIMRRPGDWLQRRNVQCFVLATPLVSFGIGLVELCLRGASSWKSLPGVALPLAMGLVVLGALGLGVVRLVLMARIIARLGISADPELQALADNLAKRLGATQSHVLLCVYDRPLALTCGLWKPTVLLSTWMVEHLDQRELEAVLAHELEHVARRDYLVTWLATVLRDAFFYVPTSWVAYRQLQREKELACDDSAVGATHRPLALASALAKVWLHAIDGPGFRQFSTAQFLVGGERSINGRIERLLAGSEPKVSRAHSPARISHVSMRGAGLLVLGAANGVLILALMGCVAALLL